MDRRNTNELTNRLTQIKEELQHFQNSTKETFKGLITKLDALDEPEIKEKFEHFQEVQVKGISKKIEYAITVLDSPIHLGLLGRYSHGKTALVNELFSIESEYALPEGEGVVTSKITKVEFLDSSVGRPICLEVYRGGNENKVDIETLKASVKGQTNDTNLDMIDYYSIRLPIREKFSELFANKKIHLIDMPGLGSPFWKDGEKTKKYIENLDMLIVVIKITKIEEAAIYIEPYIQNLSIPIIPVLTFFDTWKESATFPSCRDEGEVFIQAKKLLKQQIPSLSKYETRIIAVSAKTNLNIGGLRECILNFVEEQNMAIQKAKKETPEVFRKKVTEISKVLDLVSIEVERALDRLQREINSLLSPKNSESFSFQKQKNRLLSEARRNITRSTKGIFSDFQDRVKDISYITKSSEIEGRLEKIENDVNQTLYKQLKDEVKELFNDFKTNLSEATANYINKLDLGELKKEALKKSISEIIETYKSDDLNLDNLKYKRPQVIIDLLKKLVMSIFDAIPQNLTNPQILMSIPIVLIMVLVSNTIKHTWFKSQLSELTALIDLVLLVIPIGLIYIVLSSGNQKRFNELRRDIIDKLLSDFNQQNISETCYQKFVDVVEKMIGEVEKELGDETETYKKAIKAISTETKKFQLEGQKIQTFVGKQLEIIKSE